VVGFEQLDTKVCLLPARIKSEQCLPETCASARASASWQASQSPSKANADARCTWPVGTNISTGAASVLEKKIIVIESCAHLPTASSLSKKKGRKEAARVLLI